MCRYIVIFMRAKINTLVILFLISLIGCKKDLNDVNKCLRGKYIEDYCEGHLIQLLDKNKLGKEWTSFRTGVKYENIISVAFNPDTSYTEDFTEFKSESVFYFQIGSDVKPKKQFILCSTDPVYFITYYSTKPCL